MSQFTDALQSMITNTSLAQKPAELCIGIVESIHPLVVMVGQQLRLTENFLWLTDAVRDYKTEISFDNCEIKQLAANWTVDESEKGTSYKICFEEQKKHEVTVYNGLKAGESVLLLKNFGGQKYLVIDRVVAR